MMRKERKSWILIERIEEWMWHMNDATKAILRPFQKSFSTHLSFTFNCTLVCI